MKCRPQCLEQLGSYTLLCVYKQVNGFQLLLLISVSKYVQYKTLLGDYAQFMKREISIRMCSNDVKFW